MKKIVLIPMIILSMTIIFIFIFFIYLRYFWSLQDSDFCDDKIIKELFVSGYNYKAVAYIRNCGATTDFSPQVAFVKTNKKNIDINNDLIFVANHSDFINISWMNTTTLLITYDVKSDYIIKQGKKWKNISIEYIKK